ISAILPRSTKCTEATLRRNRRHAPLFKWPRCPGEPPWKSRPSPVWEREMTSDESQTFSTEELEASAEAAAEAALRAGTRAADLVEAWVRGKNAAAVAALANDEKAPSLARKAARRGLAVLKARGVPIPERSHVARVGGDAVEEHEAWFVAPDAAATSAILLV